MFVELIYDKRNVAGLPGAREMIRGAGKAGASGVS